MTKNIYVMPSVQVTEMISVQTLCASAGTGGGGGNTFSGIDPGITTDEQL